MKKLFLTISILIFISACGGGGYGSSSTYNNNNNNNNGGGGQNTESKDWYLSKLIQSRQQEIKKS